MTEALDLVQTVTLFVLAVSLIYLRIRLEQTTDAIEQLGKLAVLQGQHIEALTNGLEQVDHYIRTGTR